MSVTVSQCRCDYLHTYICNVRYVRYVLLRYSVHSTDSAAPKWLVIINRIRIPYDEFLLNTVFNPAVYPFVVILFFCLIVLFFSPTPSKSKSVVLMLIYIKNQEKKILKQLTMY